MAAVETVCVIGLGYIGLPTAAMFATNGARVVGVDKNRQLVALLERGGVHIEEAGLAELVQAATARGSLVVRTAPEPADAFIIAVPTPITAAKRADMGAVVAATESITPLLRPGNLVILESTSPPRTTTDLVRPILERSGLRAGRDFHLAYSPERVLPGQILRELVENARVIGGIDRASAEAGRALYARFVRGEIVLTDATTAEMVKLMENTFRDVNIALANEFSQIAERLGVDIWEAIEIANRHPRVHVLRPGPGVGGHCIAVDPWFLVEAAPDDARLIRQARTINDEMPARVVARVRRAAGSLARPVVACLGIAYKAGVGDIRESPALEVIRRLQAEGMEVRAYDPHVPASAITGQVHSLEAALEGADVVVILTDHAEFRQLAPHAATLFAGKAVIDTRNALSGAGLGSCGQAPGVTQ